MFNGDLGVIAAVDTEEQEVTVQFEERFVDYDYADINELALAWAVTIHYLLQNIYIQQQQQRVFLYSWCRDISLQNLAYTTSIITIYLVNETHTAKRN